MLGDCMIKKLLNYFFILVAVSSSVSFAMEKELPEINLVPKLTTLAAEPIAKELWIAFKHKSSPLSKLNWLATKLPREALASVLNFNLGIIEGTAPRTFLIASLHWNQPSPELVKRLIELGADVNIQDGYGRTPLEWAIYKFPETKEGIEVVRMLAKASVNIDAMADKGGKTILYYAMSKPKFLQILKDAGADITKSLFTFAPYFPTEGVDTNFPRETFKILKQARAEKESKK